MNDIQVNKYDNSQSIKSNRLYSLNRALASKINTINKSNENPTISKKLLFKASSNLETIIIPKISY